MSARGARIFPFIQRQGTLILVAGAGLMLAGGISLSRLASGIYPEIDFPRIVVVARAGDTPPELMQASVVRPLEEALATVIGVRRIRTRIIRGSAEISLQFMEGTDMWRSLQLTDVAIGNVREELPPGTEVVSQKVTPADFPILSFNLTGGTSIARREAAEFIVRPAFSRVPGVGRIEVGGGDPREVEVSLDPLRLAAVNLRPSQVARRVGEGIVRRAVGRFDEWRQTVTTTTATRAADPDELASLPVAAGPNGTIPLRDVARVFEGSPDRTQAVHAPEGDAVQLSVSRMLGASAPDVVRGIEDSVTSLTLPSGLTLREVYNQGQLIHDSILGIRDAIGIGIFLTVGVLAFFLRNLRAGVLAALSVPTTLLVTFLVMQAAGQTLNLMSLGGMAVAIGLVIDDAIVVVEAVGRRLESGAPPQAAVSDALDEITAPVVGTTITTIVVFFPLAFLSGVAGSFFAALAVTLASAVGISLLFALLVLPLLAARFLKPLPARRRGRRKRDALSTRYAVLLRRVLRRRSVVLGTVAVALVLGLAAIRIVPTGFLPEMDEGAFVLDYFLPAGTSLQATSAAAARIEAVLGQTPGVRTWARRTGAELGPVTATQVNRGDIAVLLAPRRSRASSEGVIESVRVRLEREVPGVRVEFVQLIEDVLNDLSGAPRPVEIKILGQDQSVLSRLAGEVEERLEGTPHLVDYYSGVEAQAPFLRYAIDADAAFRAGLSPAEVAEDLSIAMQGAIVGSIPRFDRLVPVRVRMDDAFRFDAGALATLSFPLEKGAIPLSRLAPPVRETGASLLMRENLTPAVFATGDVEGNDLGGLVRTVRQRLSSFALPAGYRIEIGGLAESQSQAFTQLFGVLSLGVFAVFTVLVAQFRSGRAALLVLMTIPPALVGAFLFLAATRVALNVSSLMGLVLLVGLVVKNGILLVQNALVLREAGLPPTAALVAAGRRRLRPILMTTLCTVFGLLPLAFSIGAGSELQRPLAIVVIGGLVFSTIATLFILPTLAGVVLPRGGSRS